MHAYDPSTWKEFKAKLAFIRRPAPNPTQPPTHPIPKPKISCWHPCSEFFTRKHYVALILAFRPSRHFIKVGLGKSSFRTHPPIPTRPQPRQLQATTPPRLRGCKKPGFSARSAKVPDLPGPTTPHGREKESLRARPAQALTRLEGGAGGA